MLMCLFIVLQWHTGSSLDPSDSLICTVVVSSEGSTVKGSGCSSLSFLSPPPTAPSSLGSPSSSPVLLSIIHSVTLSYPLICLSSSSSSSSSSSPLCTYSYIHATKNINALISHFSLTPHFPPTLFPPSSLGHTLRLRWLITDYCVIPYYMSPVYTY